jgi:membrane protein YdbS with pleckstrin-like domain
MAVDLSGPFSEFQTIMALINCPECGKQVSTAAKACPSCGFPVAEEVAQEPAQVTPAAAPASNELLAEVRASWWNFFWHLVFFWLVVPLIIAWYRRASMKLRIFPGRISIERGVFSKCYQDYLPRDIRSIDVDQSFAARLVGIGNITISTAATAEASEKIEGIPDPKGIRELILAQRGGQ